MSFAQRKSTENTERSKKISSEQVRGIFLDAGVGFERPQIAFLITIQSLSCSLLRQH